MCLYREKHFLTVASTSIRITMASNFGQFCPRPKCRAKNMQNQVNLMRMVFGKFPTFHCIAVRTSGEISFFQKNLPKSCEFMVIYGP